MTDLDVSYYEDVLPISLVNTIYDSLRKTVFSAGEREIFLMGDEGLIYQEGYTGSRIKVIPWERLSYMKEIKKLVANITGQDYDVCVVNYYHSGRDGIGFHRDKEVPYNTKIAGLSLGAVRKICFQRDNEKRYYTLANGSLYVINPPTNFYWKHSIIREYGVKEGRISFTFRKVGPKIEI